MQADQLIGGLSAEGRASGEALVKGGRGRVDIAGRAGRGAGHLLGCRVQQGARRNRVVTGARRDAEVGQLADPVPFLLCYVARVPRFGSAGMSSL
jgi:hypothetical protein